MKRQTNLKSFRPFSRFLCLLSVLVSAPAPNLWAQPSEWDPISLGLGVGATSDGLGFGIEAGRTLGRGDVSVPESKEAKSKSRQLPRDEVGKRGGAGHLHIAELLVGYLEADGKGQEFLREGTRDEDLEIFYASAGYRFLRRYLLEEEAEGEKRQELRWFTGAGIGLYDLGPTRRLGFHLKAGGQYAFGAHASRAIELGLHYHRPLEELDIYELRLTYSWRPRSRS